MVERAEGIAGAFIVATTGGISPVVLISLSEGRSLPIYIGLWEAISIGSALRGESPPRPFTHDLFAEALKKFNITLTGVYIDSLQDGVYYATLHLSQENRTTQLDARPSDGIALALRCGAPISVDDNVIAAAAVRKSDLPDLADLEDYLNT